MFLSAPASLYPLRQEYLGAGIRAFNGTLKAAGLSVTPGPMSTVITGEAERLFAALQDAFLAAAETGHVVLTLTISNACPAQGPS